MPAIEAPEFSVNAEFTNVVPLPDMAFASSPEALNVPVFVIVPVNFVISDANVPEVIVTLFAIEPVPTVTVPVPALISVSPPPVIATPKSPAVKFKVPELATVFFNVPAPVVNFPVVAAIVIAL